MGGWQPQSALAVDKVCSMPRNWRWSMLGASKEDYRAAPTRYGNCYDWANMCQVPAESVPHDP